MLLCFGSFIMMPRREGVLCDVDHRDTDRHRGERESRAPSGYGCAKR